MNHPKGFISTLLLGALALYVLTWLMRDRPSTEVRAIVDSQTVTQSLDGNRRFLNVTTESQQQLLIQVPANIDCPHLSQVIIQQQQTLLSDSMSYQLIRCVAAQ